MIFFFLLYKMKAPRRCGCDVGSIPNEDAEVSEKRNSIRNAGRGRAKPRPSIRQAGCNAITNDWNCIPKNRICGQNKMVKCAQCSSNDRCETILLETSNFINFSVRGKGGRRRGSYFRFNRIAKSISNDKLSCIRNKKDESVAEKERNGRGC